MSLKIKMTCPRCGNASWIRRDDGFECARCGEFCYPEDMSSLVKESEVDVIRKALADWRPELNHIIETLGTEELLAQLAEEASELGKAALKLRRALNGKNPTPVSPADALLNVQEEMADVLLCILSVGFDQIAAERTIRTKIPRWVGRIDHDEDSDCPAPSRMEKSWSPRAEKAAIYTHDEAANLVELFEDVLDSFGIKIPSPEDDEREPDNEAKLYGSTYSDLLSAVEYQIVNLLARHKQDVAIIENRFSGLA